MVRATVYNNLNYLSENGLIRRVRMHGGPDHFDGVLESHEHLVCDVCGKISDLSIKDIRGASRPRVAHQAHGLRAHPALRLSRLPGTTARVGLREATSPSRA